MDRIYLLLSIIVMMILLVAADLRPGTPLFWFASTSMNYQYFRGALSFVMMLQIITGPPRNTLFRVFTGLLSVGTLAWCIQAIYFNQMMPLDGLAFLGVGIAIGVVSLEGKLKRSSNINVTKGRRIYG
jgi:hypothetical protein